MAKHFPLLFSFHINETIRTHTQIVPDAFSIMMIFVVVTTIIFIFLLSYFVHISDAYMGSLVIVFRENSVYHSC